MPKEKFLHTVCLVQERCVGCINCMKRCPTGAIRVHGGKAHINAKFCIDCGECIRVCTHRAKVMTNDSLSDMGKYKYTIALPDPALFGQFNHLRDVNIVLNALLDMGFDDVFEVGAAAELVSQAAREYMDNHPEITPVISSACPSIVRLIRVKFPNLIPNLLPIKAPQALAAEIAVKQAMETLGFAREEIGIFYITPCPAKETFVREPLGVEKCEIDRVIAIKDIYPELVRRMDKIGSGCPRISAVGKQGILWGRRSGESIGLDYARGFLAADGIENCIKVLEELEDNKIQRLKFVELNACSAGCVGGTMTVENPFVAEVKLKRVANTVPDTVYRLTDEIVNNIYWDDPVEYEQVYGFDGTLQERMASFRKVENIFSRLPGLDCGSCGAPTCRALAEDIVKGEAKGEGCVFFMRKNLARLTSEMDEIKDILYEENIVDEEVRNRILESINRINEAASRFKNLGEK